MNHTGEHSQYGYPGGLRVCVCISSSRKSKMLRMKVTNKPERGFLLFAPVNTGHH